MEDRIWRTVCVLLEDVPGGDQRCVYKLRDVLRAGLWSILHDRPFCWACVPSNWPPHLRPGALPTQSTLSRRWRTRAVKSALERLLRTVLGLLGPLGRYGAIDGRPLLIGGASRDPDARAGRAVRGLGRGYKLHAIVTASGVIAEFVVRPMNQAEQTVARALLRRAPRELQRIIGDTIFDCMPVHEVAQLTGRRLYTPIRQNRVGRRRQARRLQLLRLNARVVGRKLLRSRDVVERTFARMSNIGFGFKGLPPWVRRQHRVHAWISGKILLYHTYLLELSQDRTLAA